MGRRRGRSSHHEGGTWRPPWCPDALRHNHKSAFVHMMLGRLKSSPSPPPSSPLFPGSEVVGASAGAAERGDGYLEDAVAHTMHVAGKRRHSSGSGSDGDIDDGCAAKRLFQDRSSATDNSLTMVHPGSDPPEQPNVLKSSITDHITHVATRLAADSVSAVAASYMVNTLVKRYSRDLKEHLNIDFTKQPSSDYDESLDTSVERILAIGTCAQLKKSSGKDEFYRFLTGTRFLCGDGAFIQYGKSVINDCLATAAAAAADSPQKHIDRLSMVSKFLLDINRHCQASLPPLMDALECGLLSLASCGHAVLTSLTHRLMMSLLKRHYVQDAQAKAAATHWRALDILPLSSEVAEVRHPVNGYLRIPGNTMPDYLRVQDRYASADEYVSVYFRLLREDCFGKVLHDISCVREGEKIQSGSHMYERIRVTGIKFLPHPPGIALALKLTGNRKSTHKNIIKGAFLAISLDPIRHRWQFATVVAPAFDRSDYDVLVTFLSPNGDDVFRMKEAMQLVGREAKAVILESPTHFLSYGPVLRVLQEYELENELPFQDVLLGLHQRHRLQAAATDAASADVPSTNASAASSASHPWAMESGEVGDNYSTEQEPWVATAPSFLTPSTELDFSWIFASAERKQRAAVSTQLAALQQGHVAAAECDTETAMEESADAVALPTSPLPPPHSSLYSDTDSASPMGSGGNSTMTSSFDRDTSPELPDPSVSAASSSLPTNSRNSEENPDTELEGCVLTTQACSKVPDNVILPPVPLAVVGKHPPGLIKCAADYSLLLADRDYHCTLDDTQREAILTALTQKVALIQGPPGTGKTFIGCRLVELLLSMKPALPGPILVITYKNRALNDFLADIAGSRAVSGEEVVRVGGMYPEGTQRWQGGNAGIYANRSKGHEIMRPDGFVHLKGHGSYTASSPQLRHMDESMAATRDAVTRQPRGFTRNTFQQFASADQRRLAMQQTSRSYVRSWAQPAKAVMVAAIGQAQTPNTPTSRRSAQAPSTASSRTHQSAYQNTNPSSRRSVSQSGPASMTCTIHSRPKLSGQTHGPVDEEASSDEERIAQCYDGFRGDFDRSGDVRGSDPNMVAVTRNVDGDDDDSTEHAIISNSICQRYAALQSPEHLEDSTTFAAANLDKLKPEQRALWICAAVKKENELHWGGLDSTLAKHSRECDEKSTERTYLLGKMLHDGAKVVGFTTSGAAIYHQLLQEIEPSVVLVEEAAEISEPQLFAAIPKSTQQLILIGDQKQLQPHVECFAVEKRGLNNSMFERLISLGHPQSVLHLQNRMRDEFAELLRLLDIYPRLETNPVTTGGNVPPSCMAESLYFWTHEYPEERSGMSYSNTQECWLVLRLAVWMMLQGITPTDITILATYKGQVRVIRDELRKLWQAMNLPLPRQSQADSSRAQRLPINVDSVDNFQGDENKIIILSLVRSNPTNSIGYLGKKNRLCVALSRARCGLYLVGDSRVLLASASGAHWKAIVEHLQASRNFGDQIRLRCPRHSEFIASFSPEEFLKLNLSAGVCRLTCLQMMRCGVHVCERSCHDHDRDAEYMPCQERVQFVHVACGHPDSRLCEKPEGSCMAYCDRKRPDCNHLCNRLCYKDCCGAPCQECNRLRCAQKRLREKAVLEERQAQKKKIEDEIAAMKDMRKDELPGSVDPVDREEDREVFDKVTKMLNHDGSSSEVSYELRRLEKVHSAYELQLNYLKCKKSLRNPDDCELLFMEVNLEGCDNKNATVTNVKSKISSLSCDDPAYRVGKDLHVARTGVRFTPGPVQNLPDPGDESVMIAFVFEVATGDVHHTSMKNQTDTFNNAEELTRKFKKDSIKLDSVPSRYEPGRRFSRYVCLRKHQARPRYVAYYVERTMQLVDEIKRLPANELIVIKREDSGLRDSLYRHAESQFHRMFQKTHTGNKPNVLTVDCFHNPDLTCAFERKVDEFKALGFPTNQQLAFHGTKKEVNLKIMQEGFRVGGKDTAVTHASRYGTGVYLAETPNTSHNFAEDGQLLLCMFLAGKVEHGDGVCRGSEDESYTCFQTPYHSTSQTVYVVKASEQVLPLFVVHYEGLK